MSRQAAQWPPLAAKVLEKPFRDLLEGVKEANASDARSDDEKMWLTRFLVVRTSGYIEQSIYELARGLLDVKSGGIVRTFAQSWIAKTRNPSPGNIAELLGRFDMTLQARFGEFIDDGDGRRKQDLELMVQRRHDIAHGKSEGLGMVTAERVAQTALEIVDWLRMELDPHASRPTRSS